MAPTCEAATCRKKGPAVVKVSGRICEGDVYKTITLNLCAECAGPLLRVGEPVSMSATVKEKR